MALRGKKPTSTDKRLKLFLYGPAGVGKTTAAVQFPAPYVIDTERGTDNYDQLVNNAGGVVYQTTDMDELMSEVRALLTERHDYKTLVIDPITTVYNDLLEKCEKKVGSDFGRHYGEANKHMKRLVNMILALDMNVIMTAHAKKEYGDNLKVLGMTFDGWKQSDYLFDLVIELQKRGKKRIGVVKKTRLPEFPDDDSFEWSFENIAARYQSDILVRDAAPVTLADPKKVKELKDLLEVVKLPEGLTDKWLTKANVETFEDMPDATLQKCLDYVRERVPASAAA